METRHVLTQTCPQAKLQILLTSQYSPVPRVSTGLDNWRVKGIFGFMSLTLQVMYVTPSNDGAANAAPQGSESTLPPCSCLMQMCQFNSRCQRHDSRARFASKPWSPRNRSQYHICFLHTGFAVAASLVAPGSLASASKCRKRLSQTRCSWYQQARLIKSRQVELRTRWAWNNRR